MPCGNNNDTESEYQYGQLNRLGLPVKDEEDCNVPYFTPRAVKPSVAPGEVHQFNNVPYFPPATTLF